MSTIINTNNFEGKLLSELAKILEFLESYSASSPTTTKKEKKERKSRDPNAKPNNWIAFTSRVRTVLKNANFTAGKECQQFASHLKNTHSDAYAMTDEEIVAARSSWTIPPSQPKEKDSAPALEDSEPKSKPKRTLSDEQKAKMAAGRKAAAEDKNKIVESSAPHTSLPPKPTSTLRPLPLNGQKYMWDTQSNGLWKANADRTKGDWVGVLSSDRKTIDRNASNPDATTQ